MNDFRWIALVVATALLLTGAAAVMNHLG